MSGSHGTAASSGVADAGVDASTPDTSDGAVGRVVPCDATHVDCDHDPSNGCEADIAGDVNHCGGCAIACASAGTTAQACDAGVCTPSCDGTHLDCNGDGKDGCEVDARSDAANCGACKHVCSESNAGSTSCIKGVCAPVCTSGFGDCTHPTATDDGCETNLGAADNCGTCGHDCGGANCNLQQKCDPLTFSNVGSSVVADATNVYWTEYSGGVAYVYRAPVRGGNHTPIISTTGGAFDGIAFDGTFVYVCDYGKNFAIRRQPVSTPGSGPVISDNSDQSVYNPCPVAVDDTNVYWTDYGSRQMFKKPKDGSGVRVALTTVIGSASFAISVDATNVYFGSRPAFAPIVLGGNGPTDPTTNTYPSASSFYIGIDDRYAYYGTDNGLARMLKNNTGTMTPLTQASAPDGPIATDDTYLYYGDRFGTSGIYKIPKSGGSPVQVSADPHISSLFVFGKALYWSTTGTGNNDAFVRRLAL